MGDQNNPTKSVQYQFRADYDEWQQWKDTIPRSMTLDDRIRELIRADIDGRVIEDD